MVNESKIYTVDDMDHIVQPFGSKLVAVKIDDKWGFMNAQGKMVISATFQDAHNFSEGLASVKTKDKWGFINTKGKFVVKAEYDKVGAAFNNGYAQVSKKGKWGMINSKGVVVIPLKYVETNMVSEGLTHIKIGQKYGFMNMKGKMVIPAKYAEAYHFQNGLAPVKSKGKWGYINKSGKLVIPYKYIDAESFKNGYARVVIQKGSNYFYGVINLKGKNVMDTKYYQILLLNDGIAPYQLQSSLDKISMGYISLKTGKTLFKVKNLIEEYSEGYAFGAYKGKLYDVIYNRNGKVTYLKNKYYDVSTFQNGYAIGTIDDSEMKFRIIHKN